MPELTEYLPLLAFMMAIGAVAGVIAGLLGVGGGIVLVPAFFYLFDHLGYGGPQLMQICLATSLATIVVTSIRSGMAHHKKGALDLSVLRQFGPIILAGAFLGVILATWLKSAALQAIFGGLAFVAGLYMSFGREQWRLGDALPKGPLKWVYGSLIGFFSALMGIGGGSFGVPMMTLYGMPIHRAVATASGFGLFIALPSTLYFLFVPVSPAPPMTIGAVNLPAFLIVVLMGLVTVPWGAKLAHAMNPKPLKRVFGGFIMLVALNMLRKALGY